MRRPTPISFHFNEFKLEGLGKREVSSRDSTTRAFWELTNLSCWYRLKSSNPSFVAVATRINKRGMIPSAAEVTPKAGTNWRMTSNKK